MSNTNWIYDWPQIIDDLEADAYTEYGKRDVRKAAGSWVTCACGNLCDEIPRGWLGMPLDDHLSYAGADFTNAILSLCKAKTVHEREIYAIGARYHLFRIDRRAAELLKGDT